MQTGTKWPAGDAIHPRKLEHIFVIGVSFFQTGKLMKQSDIFRENAENCLHMAEQSQNNQAFNRYQRMAKAWFALADEMDWLEGETPATIETRNWMASASLRPPRGKEDK